MIAVLLPLLLVLQLHSHASSLATQFLGNADSNADFSRIFSRSGQMSIYWRQNSTYQFALCLAPAEDGTVVLKSTVEVHPDLLRNADVFVTAASAARMGQTVSVLSTTQQILFVLDQQFFTDDGRFEVSLVAEFKNHSQQGSHERLSIRVTKTCVQKPPPPPPINARPPLQPLPFSRPKQPSHQDAFSSLFAAAANCITPSCLAKTYLQYHALALKHLQDASDCAEAPAGASVCADADASRINFVMFRFIPATGWGNSALLLMEAMLFALADWRILLIDSTHHEHITTHISSPFVTSNAAAEHLYAAAGVLPHQGRHMGAYLSDVYASSEARVAPAPVRLIVIEITDDAVLPGIHGLAAANALRFPAVLDILPPFTYDSLGFLSRMVLQPSAAVLASINAMKQDLSARGCARTVGIHFRGGFLSGDHKDFRRHENVHPTSLARVVQTARQVADDGDGRSSSDACFLIAGDHARIRDFAREALQSWGFFAVDISAPDHVIANVGVERSMDAARAALQEWFMLSTTHTVIVQLHSSFGLSAGLHGGCAGFTVAEHRVINGFSCFPWCVSSFSRQHPLALL